MLTKFFNKKSAGSEGIRAGSVFRRVRPDNTVETATVLSIREDCLGIPHVRYEFTIGRADKHVFEQGPRVLSLACFAEHFHDDALAS